MSSAATLSYDEYQSARYFPALDGVRAVSVVMVIVWHMRTWNHGFERLNGWTGVTVFFVLSGFLITTLCLRESARATSRRFDLAGFYIRRAFRILPLYVFTILVATLLFVFARSLWILNPPRNFWESMGYYLTMSVDLIHQRPQPLGHLWSVGIEEKFYVLWPVALLGLVALPRTLRTLASLALVAVPAMWTSSDYAKLYLGITLGCFLAFALDDPRTYAVARRVAALGRGACFALALAALLYFQFHVRDRVHGTRDYAYAACVVVGLLVVRGNGSVAGALSSPVARWLGRRSYGMYLFFPFAVHGIEPWLGFDDSSVPRMLVRFVLSFAIVLVTADLAHRFIEVPLIRRGRRVAAARTERRRGHPRTPTEHAQAA